MNYLSWIFWTTCCSFYTSPWCFALHFDVIKWLLSLNLMNQPLLASNFSSALSAALSAFTELKRVGVLLWRRPCLKGMAWLVWSSTQTTKTFFISAIKLLCFLIVCVLTVALFISFKNFPSCSQLDCLAQQAWLSTHLGFRHAFLTELNHFYVLI